MCVCMFVCLFVPLSQQNLVSVWVVAGVMCSWENNPPDGVRWTDRETAVSYNGQFLRRLATFGQSHFSPYIHLYQRNRLGRIPASVYCGHNERRQRRSLYAGDSRRTVQRQRVVSVRWKRRTGKPTFLWAQRYRYSQRIEYVWYTVKGTSSRGLQTRLGWVHSKKTGYFLSLNRYVSEAIEDTVRLQHKKIKKWIYIARLQ